MSRREEFLNIISQKQNLRELFIMRFTSNIHLWDSLVNDAYSTEDEFDECFANWYKIKNECEKHFSLREVDELVDLALRRVADETLQRDASDTTTD